MASNRLTRVNQLLQREIAGGMYKVINVEGFDMSLVTITRVFTSPDLRHARVLVSIRGKDEEVREHLNLLKKFRVDLQQEVFSKVTLKYSPRFRFELPVGTAVVLRRLSNGSRDAWEVVISVF